MTTSQIDPNKLRPGGDDRHGNIILVDAKRRLEALARLVSVGAGSDIEHARRFMEYAASHKVDLGHLWARLDGFGRVDSAVLGVPSPGRTAMIFASRPVFRQHAPALAGLISHACEALKASGVDLAQVLLDPGEVLERETFLAAGFEQLARLSYLERPIGRRSPAVEPPQFPADVQIDRYVSAARAELLNVLDASYEDTLDCPGLRGRRRTSDILEGHCAAGAGDQSLWVLLRERGKAIGTLLLNPSADGRSVELVYLGLAKPARGRGLGQQLLRYGLQVLAKRREETVHLAVDEANAPALKLYESEGFRLSLRRIALIRPSGDSGSIDDAPARD